jgi:hypothetical protein
MEEIAAVSLDVRDVKGEVIGLELIRSEYLGRCTVEIVILGPRSQHLGNRFVSVKRAVLVGKIAVAVYLVVLIDVSKVSLAGLKHDSLICLLFCEIEIVEGNDGGSRRISSK